MAKLFESRARSPAVSRARLRIILPLVLAIGVLLATFAFAIWRVHQLELMRAANRSAGEVRGWLHAAEVAKIAVLTSMIEAVVNDDQMTGAFRNRDRAALLARAQPLFDSLNRTHGVTHFYFDLPDRTVFLRVHDPGSYGDGIARHTMLEAERTKKVSAGFEHGLAGTFTLRVVAPWHQDGRLLGYIELGAEFEEIVRDIQRQVTQDIDFVVAVDKKLLNQELWAAAVKREGHTDDWKRFARMVVINKSVRDLPQSVIEYLGVEDRPRVPRREGDLLMAFLPLTDVTGKALGGLVVVQNVAEQALATRRAIQFVTVLGGLVGAAAIVFLNFFLTRAESSLSDQTAELQDEIAERKGAEAALLRQQTELRVLFDLMPAMIWFKDTENGILRVNKRVAEAVGKPVGEIEGKPSREIYPRDADAFYADDLEVIRSGAPKLGIVETIRGDSSADRWVQTDKVPVCDQGGRVIGIVVMAQDITERRGIEQELKEAKLAAVLREGALRYSFLADAVPLIIWTARPDGGLDYYNKGWFEYTGLTLEQTRDWGWGAVLHPDDLQSCIDRWTHSFTTGEDYEIEYRFKRALDGSFRWFLGRASARRNAEGKVVQWVGTCTDIDDQKRANTELESRVAARTMELARANVALQLENAERQLAAAALLESQRFLQSTLDALSSHIAILDGCGTIIEVNGAWKRFACDNDFMGGRRGVGDNYLTVCDSAFGDFAAEASAVSEGIRAIIAGRDDEFHLEYPCHSTREKRWFIVRATRFGGDGPVRVVVAHENITARKQAENALRESNEKFQQVADNITDAFWIRSPDMRVLHYVSPAFERIWDRSVASLYANPQQWTDFIIPEDRARVIAAFAALSGDSRSLDIEYRIARPDGEVRWVRVRGFQVRDAADRLIRHLGIVTDITESRRVEQILRESEERMRLQSAALESAVNGVIITDREGSIQWVNAAFTQLTGFSTEEAVGRNPRFLKSGHHPESFYSGMWDTISQGRSWKGELINRHKSGRLYSEEMSITPVRDANGAVSHFIAVKMDISDRKQAEDSIQELHKRLLEASRQAGMAEIATGVLHNVGNVLNSVNVSATLVADHVRHTKAGSIAKLAVLFDQHKADLAGFLTKDPRGQMIPAYLDTLAEMLLAERETVTAELENLRKNIEHIKEIVAMQQTYARTSGVIETVSVTDLIEDALRINAGSLARHDVDLTRDYQARPVVTTDKHKVMQILINLVRNAKYACDESGGTNKQITVRTTGAKHGVRIDVIDNGVGILAENLTRVFNHGFTTRKDGHGFGLHSGALAAREIGGSLIAHSDGAGCGATFTLELPM